MEFKDILVPHDGEETSDKALDNAIKIAKLVQDSEITLLHILEIALPPSLALRAKPIHSFKTGEMISPEAYIKEIYLESKQEFLKKYKNIRQKCNDIGVSFHIKIDIGDPAEKILEHANENKANLIVMGRERRKGISKYVSFGSVAKKVAENSPCPIMLIH
jgi:nucleotide-binding universal stress UspA family protein